MNATIFSTILHDISQALMQPTIIILILLIAYAVWCIGSILTELLMDRRRYKQDTVAAFDAIDASSWEQVSAAINNTRLLNRHKKALLTLVSRGWLDEDTLMALARSLLDTEEEHYSRIVSRMELIAKIAPMLGLMGTLIPLGPGITALGDGNLEGLSTSLNIAFDTTVAGLVTAIIALSVTRFRRHWYEGYLANLDAMMTAIMDKAAVCKPQRPASFDVTFEPVQAGAQTGRIAYEGGIA